MQTSLENVLALRRLFGRQVEAATLQIAEFQASLGVDPAHALRFADKIFAHAAAKTVAQRYASFIDDVLNDILVEIKTEDVIARIVEEATREVLRARTVEGSTSACSNLLDRHTIAAQAEILDRIKFF